MKRRGSYRPRGLRIRIYEDVLELRGKGLSYREIINEIKGRYGVVISKSQCSKWSRGIHSPLNGIRIPSVEFLKPSEDLAYVIGVVAGDGCAWQRGGPQRGYRACIIRLEVKDREFDEEFGRRLAKVLGREPPRPRLNKYGRWVTVVKSRTLYELLKKPIDIEKIGPFVEHCERCITMFLRGFFDSEACVSRDGTITVTNTDYKLLKYVIYLLKKIGIETTSDEPKMVQRAGRPFRNPERGKLYKRRKTVYYIYIRRGSNLRFYKVVGFTIERKRIRLEEYLKRRELIPIPLPLLFLSTPCFTLTTISQDTYRLVDLLLILGPRADQLSTRKHKYHNHGVRHPVDQAWELFGLIHDVLKGLAA